MKRSSRAESLTLLHLSLALLVMSLARCQFPKQLSTSGATALQAGESLISPLGKYKATLESQNCRFTLYSIQDSNNTYVQVGSYDPPTQQVADCQQLRVEPGRVMATLIDGSSADYTAGRQEQSSGNYQWAQSDETCLSVDDNGRIALLAFQQRQNHVALPSAGVYQLYAVPQNQQSHGNIIAASAIDLGSVTGDYTNANQWSFTVGSNQLTISKNIEGQLLSQQFSLESMNLTPAGLYDDQNRGIPMSSFQDALLFPRCDAKKAACQVRAPYAIELDRNWPVLRVYDSERYLIAEYDAAERGSFEKSRICPKATFLYKGECRKECPSPYYAKVQGPYGQCVLTCPTGSVVDYTNRVCACSQADLSENVAVASTVKKCQRQWPQYFYGCDCTHVNRFYDRQNTLSCQENCASGSFGFDGLCLDCPQNCLSCAKDPNFSRFLRCQSCAPGYQLTTPSYTCVRVQEQTCEPNCIECEGSECLRCQPFYSLKQGNCVLSCGSGFTEVARSDSGSECLQNGQLESDYEPGCFVGCTQCLESRCRSCAPGYILFVSPLSSTCKLESATFSCSEPDYTYDSERRICSVRNQQTLMMNRCRVNIPHCQTCQYNSENGCTVCDAGYFLHQYICLSECPPGYVPHQGTCIQKIENCDRQSYSVEDHPTAVNLDVIKNSQSYRKHIADGVEPANDQGGYSLYKREFLLQEDTANQTVETVARSIERVCVKCRRGYGLSSDRRACVPCPESCSDRHCYYAREDSCYSPTPKCTFLNENNECLESCPEGRFPQVDSEGVRRCLPESMSSVSEYLKMDSSSYEQDDGSKIYYFILDKPVENETLSTARLLFQKRHPRACKGSEDEPCDRLLVETEEVASLQEGQFIEVRDTEEEAVAVIFDEKVGSFRTASGVTLANSVYGAENEYTHNQWMKEWLAFIGYVLSWVLLLVHALYVGNAMLYKADNLIVFCQTAYFFSFVNLLVGNHLAQFYYGWIYMHLGFWPNYFESSIPSQYDEHRSPLSYKLHNLDANLIRNAGFAISLLLTFLAAWLLIVLVVFVVSKACKKTELWYHRVAKNSLIAGVELLSMVIFFFSVAHLLHGEEFVPESESSFNDTNTVFSIIFVCLLVAYMVVRFLFNRIGGLYMFKRLSIALILVDAYDNRGFLALLVAFEILFTILRFVLEKPRLLREKVYMLAEGLLFILGYFLMFLVTVTGVNVIIVTLIVFILLMFLIADLIDTYLESRNEFYDFDLFGAKYDNQHQNKGDDAPESQRRMVK